MPNRRKLSLALTVMACSMTVAAQISSLPSSWDGQRWTDQYMGKTWNKTWQNGQLVASTDERQAEHWMADLPDNMFVAHVSIPGAHNFATGEENWAGDTYSSSGNASSTTQAVTMPSSSTAVSAVSTCVRVSTATICFTAITVLHAQPKNSRRPSTIWSHSLRSIPRSFS